MWSCKACTFENADSTKECEVCQSSKDDDKERWQCFRCCQLNACDRTVCAVCDYPCLLDDGNGKEPGVTNNEKHLTRETASSIPQSDESTTAGDEEPETVDVWVCQKKVDDVFCCANNKINDLKCIKCSASKPYISSLLVVSKVPVLEAGLQDMSVRDTNPGAACSMGEPERKGGRPLLKCTQPPLGRCSSNSDRTEDGLATGSGGRRLSEPSRVRAPSPALVGAYAKPWEDETANYYLADEKEEEIIEFPDAECRMVLVGKTGTGKSSTANTIVGMINHFKISPAFHSETKTCERVNTHRFGIQLEVMDTPGLFDTTDQTFVAREIAKCMAVMAPGPHAIILVLRFGVRFTEEEAKAIDKVYDIFGDQLLRFLVIVFTHADKLTENEGITGFEKLLSSAPAKLRKLIEDSQKRYVLFNNEADKEAKDMMVKKLLETIKNLLKVNGGRPYTSNLLNKVENKMLERERQLESHYGVQAMPATDRKRGAVVSFREMVREEAMDGKSFLEQIKDILFPFLSEMFKMIRPILLQFIQRQLQKKLQNDSCSFL